MKKAMRTLIPILLAALIIASIGWYLFVYDRGFTRDILLQQARFNDTNGNARLSSWFYDLAYNFSGKDQNVAIELANQYKADDNYTKAESTLSNAIKYGPTAELYMALSKTYVEQDKLLDAVSLISNISDEEIKAELEALRPAAPAANYEPGFYSQYIDVELTSTTGTLYCNVDGEVPSVLESPYSAPITLPAGETLIHAISVDENGLCSPMTVLGYTVGGVIEPAIFTDAGMEAAVRAALGDTSDKVLYTDKLWTLREFTVPAEVTNLEDLKLLPYLRTLTIQSHDLNTLDFLADMVKLETLDLSGSRFPSESLEVLGNLTTLQNLNLSDTGISTIAGLAEVSGLTTLNLSGNTIRNLTVLSNMTKLTDLNLQHNALTDLGALAPLTKLEKLDISFNSVTSLVPLGNCIKLTALNAENNQLTNLDGLDSLTLLSTLIINYNSISDLSVLSSCVALTHLSASNNALTDLTPLANLKDLDFLGFSYNEVTSLPQWVDGCALRAIDGSYNQIESIDTLSPLEQLTYVYMDYNKLTSVNILADCYHLVQVNAFGNEISDVSALQERDIIVNFDPTN